METTYYFDYNATTPVDPRVVEVMEPFFNKNFHNPSSFYRKAGEANYAVEVARKQTATLINAAPEEIFFTSGGTESDNLGIQGIVFKYMDKGNHIITSKIEHDCVLNACKWLEEQGAKVTYLDVDKPIAQGIIVPPEYHMEAKYQMQQAMKNAKKVIKEVNDEFAQRFGRSYGGLIDKYRMDDAEYAYVTMGSGAGNARTAVDELRAKGEKVGLIKIRVYRPWFGEEFNQLTKKLKGVISVERAHSFGSPGGILGQDVKSSLFNAKQTPYMAEYCFGLGGRDCLVKEWVAMYERSKKSFTEEKNLPYYWWGVRE